MSQRIIIFDCPEPTDDQSKDEYFKAHTAHAEACCRKLEEMLEGDVRITARLLFVGCAGVNGSEEALLRLKEKVEAAGLGTMIKDDVELTTPEGLAESGIGP